MKILIYFFAIIGVITFLYIVISETISNIRHKINIRRYYKQLYKERPDLDPKNRNHDRQSINETN